MKIAFCPTAYPKSILANLCGKFSSHAEEDEQSMYNRRL